VRDPEREVSEQNPRPRSLGSSDPGRDSGRKRRKLRRERKSSRTPSMRKRKRQKSPGNAGERGERNGETGLPPKREANPGENCR